MSWDDYLYWQRTDKKIVKRIDELLKSCVRTPFEGIGKPEALKGDLPGYWSRRMTLEDRLAYKYQDRQLLIAACRYHYGKESRQNITRFFFGEKTTLVQAILYLN